MGRTARERLARLLDDAEAPGSFSAQILAPADALRVEVVGLGAVQTPVRGPLAKKLIAVGRPAKFGRAEQTLTDTSVRDTWEITPDLVTLGGPAWEATLGAVLDDVRDELGLPPTTRLRAELHAMLVYGKGQFFLPHQDSEKDDAMVGTLVVSLPSAHTGGELVVEHGGESVTYRTSKQDLSFVAFYADCRHEVKPVTSGYRVTLTFNLLADGEADAQGSGPAADLARCLTEHFATPAAPRYGRTDLDPPNRLVYLLDHEYTQRGLSWNRLKGADAERAALLRAAAERAGCEAVLALAEVKETWDAWPSDEDPWDDYDYEEENEEDEDDNDDAYRDRGGDHDDYQLNDLIDDEITLGWWTSPDGAGGEPISLYVPDSEVCASTPSANLTPYQSEYEGYMGNYGNTLDRWYRRAAVVVWPRERAFAARAEAGSQWALSQLRTRSRGRRSGRGACRRGVARAVLENNRIAGGTAGYRAAGGGGPGRCRDGSDAAGAVPGRDARAGARWRARGGGRAVRRGSGPAASSTGGSGRGVTPNRTGTSGWRALPGLCAALRAAGAPQVARLLAAGAWGWMDDQLRFWTSHRAGRDPPAAAGDAELATGAAPGGGRRRAAGRDRGGAARVRGQRAGVPDACAAFGGRAAGGRAAGCRARRGRAGLRATARRDHRAAAARRRRLVDRMDRVRVRPVRHAGDVSRLPGRDGPSSGRWRQTGGGTYTPGSTRPGCRCGTRPGGRDGRTRWC